MKHNDIPVLGFCAHSGTGKTTLLTKILPLLEAKGIAVGVIKHAHHNFDVDQEGKDSYELRKAGAKRTCVSSSKRWVLIHENVADAERSLAELIDKINDKGLDLILVEGFKKETIDKIELYRQEVGSEPMHLTDDCIIAVASNAPAVHGDTIQVLDIDDPEAITEFILRHCKLSRSSSSASAC